MYKNKIRMWDMKAVSYWLLLCLLAALCLSCERASEPDYKLTLSIWPDSGGNAATRDIVVTCNVSGADIRYTLDGSEPNLTSRIYARPLTFGDIIDPELNWAAFKVKAFKEGYEASDTVDRFYSIIYDNTVATPVISPESGTYAQGTTISISCSTPGTQIYYIANNANRILYQQPITITHSGYFRIKAIALRQGWNPSSEAISNLFFSHPVQEMVPVEGGTFSNGSSNVTLGSFYMDKHEVVQSEYFDVMGAFLYLYTEERGNYPVYYTSWFNAIEYCNRRSMLEGLSPCYSYDSQGFDPECWAPGWNQSDANHTKITCNWDANGYRLPTEMEWMHAARGGNLSHNYYYSGSDSLYAVGWYAGNSSYTVHQVEQKEPNELGIYDLSGNLGEWCWDIFATYPAEATVNPHGPTTGTNRVIRGGAWNSPANMCLVPARNSFPPSSSQAASIGFRCVRKQ